MTHINTGEVLNEIKHPRMRRNCNRSRTPEHKHTNTCLAGSLCLREIFGLDFKRLPLFICMRGASDNFFQITTTTDQ